MPIVDTPPDAVNTSRIRNDLQLELIELLRRLHVVTTDQAHRYAGLAAQRSLRATQWNLHQLFQSGCVHRVREGQNNPYRWLLTSAGAELSEHPHHTTYRPRVGLATGVKARHHLAVVEFGSYLAEAAAHHDNLQFGFRDLPLEVELNTSSGGRNRPTPIWADATLRFSEDSPSHTALWARIVEVDRGTERFSVLADKVLAYHQWATTSSSTTKGANNRPRWQNDFPDLPTPPPVLFVFDCDPNLAWKRTEQLDQLIATRGLRRPLQVQATTLEAIRRARDHPSGAAFTPGTTTTLGTGNTPPRLPLFNRQQ